MKLENIKYKDQRLGDGYIRPCVDITAQIGRSMYKKVKPRNNNNPDAVAPMIACAIICIVNQFTAPVSVLTDLW